MKKLLPITTFLLLLIVASCSKEKLEIHESTDPIFQIQGTIDGDEIVLTAGDQNAFMFTNTESINGVNRYAGRLSNGSSSVKIAVYDGNVDIPGNYTVDVLPTIALSFAEYQSQDMVTLSKYSLNNFQSIESIDWYLNGAFAGTDEVVIDEPGLYNVCAMINFMDQSVTSLCNEIIVGYAQHANFTIEFDHAGGNLFTAEVNSFGNAVSDIKWYVNDTLVSESNVLDYNMYMPNCIMEAEVNFQNGVKRRKAIYLDKYNLANSTGDFSVFEEQSVNFGYFQDYRFYVEIENNGVTYRSDYANNANSTINVIGFEHYGQNANGKDVYKIDAVIDTFVKESPSSGTQLPVQLTTSFGIEIQ